MAVVNQVGNSLTGSTGTGAFVGANTPTLRNPTIQDSLGNTAITIATNGGGTAVNYWEINNSSTTTPLALFARGTDSNISTVLVPKGTGAVVLFTAAPTTPFVLYSGTGNQHLTEFAFANTAASRTLTFPDVTGTVTVLGNASTGSGSVVLATSPTLTTPVLGVASATSISFGGSALGNYVSNTAFTPSITIGGSSVGITYTTQLGIYTRIGSVVAFNINITLSSKGGLTGPVLVAGLPIVTQSSILVTTTFPVIVQTVTYSAGQSVVGLNNPGNTVIKLLLQSSASALVDLDGTNLANTSVISISGTYLV